jgi:hypothetical protein
MVDPSGDGSQRSTQGGNAPKKAGGPQGGPPPEGGPPGQGTDTPRAHRVSTQGGATVQVQEPVQGGVGGSGGVSEGRGYQGVKRGRGDSARRSGR